MSELIWPQFLIVLLPDSHNEIFSLQKVIHFVCVKTKWHCWELPQLCKTKSRSQHTKSGAASECLSLLMPDFYVSLNEPLLSPCDQEVTPATLPSCVSVQSPSLAPSPQLQWCDLPGFCFAGWGLFPFLLLPSKMPEQVVQSTFAIYVGSLETEWRKRFREGSHALRLR